ncbi:MAG: YitT family protein [Bacilli bacterium]|nr:YitT family protein [Bacilli bacterium]
MLRKMSKIELKYFARNLFYIIFGSLALAFGTALFLTKLNIVAGGLSGIAIVIQYFFGEYFLGGQSIDIIVLVCTWLLFFVGLFTLGKDFAMKTLVSSIVYPLALSLFLRVPMFIELSERICYYGVQDISAVVADPTLVPIGNLLLCGIFGGVFIGFGVALNFLGGGSTGGVDVLIALITKLTGFKESVVSFCIDASIILIAMFIIPDNIVPALNGILSAFVTALMIEYFYIGKQTSYQADIISDKWEEISRTVQDVLGRGATVIKALGGYQYADRVVLRVVFDKTQYKTIREIIGRIDPTAFMTFTQTNGVYGEGFKQNSTRKNKKKSEE